VEYPLRERVIAIVGPLSSTVQSLMNGFTKDGADVALLNNQASQAERFCAQLTDQREVSSKHGRAMAIQVDSSDSASIKEAIGRAAQSFGGLDVLIDAQLHNEASPLDLNRQEVLGSKPTENVTASDSKNSILSLESELDGILQKNLKSTLLWTAAVAGYLKARKKGRIIYLFNESCFRGQPEDALVSAARTGLVQFAASFSKSLAEHNVTINCLGISYTEEFLLARDSGSVIKAALEKQRSTDRFARITEPDKITNAIIYLIGPSGASINGQCIHLS
jgi:3-oxoacyl-[acyl-carrier protein] reductase